MSEFTQITYDGDYVTSPMPPDETVVEVKLKDGTERLAWYGQNIMEAGDFDFVPVESRDDEPGDAESIAGQVVAWR